MRYVSNLAFDGTRVTVHRNDCDTLRARGNSRYVFDARSLYHAVALERARHVEFAAGIPVRLCGHCSRRSGVEGDASPSGSSL
jgi:hypothetical protein